MELIDDPSNIPAAQAPLATVSPGWFRRPSTISGDQGTILTGDWANDVQGAITDAILAASIALQKGNFTQLTQAIPILAQPPIDNHALVQATQSGIGHIELASVQEVIDRTDTLRAITPIHIQWAFEAVKADPGYIIIPSAPGGDLYIQWGSEANLKSASELVTLPIAFPTNFFAAFASSADAWTGSEDPKHSPGAKPSGLTQISLSSNNDAGAPVNPLVYWWALGN